MTGIRYEWGEAVRFIWLFLLKIYGFPFSSEVTVKLIGAMAARSFGCLRSNEPIAHLSGGLPFRLIHQIGNLEWFDPEIHSGCPWLCIPFLSFSFT